MSKVIVSLPGLTPEQARQLVRNALYDWRRARGLSYVDSRYAHMSEEFRYRRQQRLEVEFAALDESEVDCHE